MVNFQDYSLFINQYTKTGNYIAKVAEIAVKHQQLIYQYWSSERSEREKTT